METLELESQMTYEGNNTITGTYEVLTKEIVVDGGFIVTLVRCIDTKDVFLILNK